MSLRETDESRLPSPFTDMMRAEGKLITDIDQFRAATAYSSAAHERIPAAQPMDEAPPGHIRSGVAQSVEQPPVKRPVAGSTPAPGAIHPFIAEAERHAYRWTEENRPLPLV